MNSMKICHDMEKISLIGKSCIVKTLAISKLIYVASVMYLQENVYVRKMQRLPSKLIWNKPEKIKRNKLKSDLNDGGLCIIDV